MSIAFESSDEIEILRKRLSKMARAHCGAPRDGSGVMGSEGIRQVARNERLRLSAGRGRTSAHRDSTFPRPARLQLN